MKFSIDCRHAEHVPESGMAHGIAATRWYADSRRHSHEISVANAADV
jgi:hypothetical protein